jgi:hypothetical protein
VFAATQVEAAVAAPHDATDAKVTSARETHGNMHGLVRTSTDRGAAVVGDALPDWVASAPTVVGLRTAVMAGDVAVLARELDLTAAPTGGIWRPDLGGIPLHEPQDTHDGRPLRKVHKTQELTLASGGVFDVGSTGRLLGQSTRAEGQVYASTWKPMPDRPMTPSTRHAPVSVRMRAAPTPTTPLTQPRRMPAHHRGSPRVQHVALSNKY